MLAKTNQPKTVNFNRACIQEAVSSGSSIKVPKGLTREEKRIFILNNRYS